MNLKHILLSALAVAALLAAGCNKTTEQTPEISLTGDSAQLASQGISAKADGGDVKLTFNSGADWTIEIAETATKAMASWVVATPPAGKSGAAEVTVSVAANSELTARQAKLSIKSGTLSTDIAIKQAGRARIPIGEVTLSETELDLVNGDEIQLVATVTPSYTDDDKTVTWTSSNPAVALVDEGLVTAVGEGTVVITASAGSKSATCTITVLHRYIFLDGLSLDKTELEIVNGDSYQLTAILDPEDADVDYITWESSDETVVTVTDGLVQAVGEGKATVTAKAEGYVATCEVTVLHKVIEVESITLDKDNVEFYVGDSETLIATINPSDADDQTVVWSTSDATVVSVVNGVITGEGEGTATITASAGGKSATCTVTVSPKVIPAESVTLDQEKATIKVGKTVTLVATVNPSYATDKSVTWKSSNDTIATVVDGVVTGVAEGKVTITVTTSNGKTATCEITVLPKGTSGEDMGDPIDEDPWE